MSFNVFCLLLSPFFINSIVIEIFSELYSLDCVSKNNVFEVISNGGSTSVNGELVSYDLDKDLIKEGLNVQRLINYNVSHIKDLRSDFLSELKKKIPDIVYIYSQNSAVSFLNLIKKYELDDYWMKTNLMCIGEKTSSVLNELKWKKIFLFNPGEEEFLLYKI